MDNAEVTQAKIDALRDSLADVKENGRQMRADLNSLRDKIDRIYGEMHAGFAALRESIAGVEKSVAALHATIRTLFWGVGVVGAMAIIFFTAGKALHWF